jgi:plasmid stabilization system protein ParE
LKRAYELLEAAEQDLRGITRYTRNKWGAQQAALYIKELGFRLVQSQKATAAARLMADRKFLASLS